MYSNLTLNVGLLGKRNALKKIKPSVVVRIRVEEDSEVSIV